MRVLHLLHTMSSINKTCCSTGSKDMYLLQRLRLFDFFYYYVDVGIGKLASVSLCALKWFERK